MTQETEPYVYILIDGEIYDNSSESIDTALCRENLGLLDNDSLILYNTEESKVKSMVSGKNMWIPSIITRDKVTFLTESDKEKYPELFI